MTTLLAFLAMQTPLTVTSAHIGAQTLTPTPVTTPVSLAVQGGAPAYPGQAAILASAAVLYTSGPLKGTTQYPAINPEPAKPGLPATQPQAWVTAGGVAYQVPASQLTVLAISTVPTTGSLSLTLVTGAGATAQAVQLSLTQAQAAFWVLSIRQAFVTAAGEMPIKAQLAVKPPATAPGS